MEKVNSLHHDNLFYCNAEQLRAKQDMMSCWLSQHSPLSYMDFTVWLLYRHIWSLISAQCWCVMHVLVLSAVTANLTTEVSSNLWQITDDVILRDVHVSQSLQESVCPLRGRADEQHRHLQRAHWHSTDGAQNKLNFKSITMRTNCKCHEMRTCKSFHFKQVIRKQK